jgi:hypothetical protein
MDALQGVAGRDELPVAQREAEASGGRPEIGGQGAEQDRDESEPQTHG